jgi:hypothetical protein
MNYSKYFYSLADTFTIVNEGRDMVYVGSLVDEISVEQRVGELS